ncbi:hypothetical protein M3Y98_00200600 [Aphelenchoides besseyi]|nr:hypothetical protein M3Y98_00200600 [Aphelenchoides besseyi]
MRNRYIDIVLCFVVLTLISVDAAKRCYSGQNARYAEKQCSSGSISSEFTCQKFICEGGKSPFTLRTCGQKNLGCLAGPRICQFSGGRARFVMRSCGAANEQPCEKEEKTCINFNGAGKCMTCFGELCNGEPLPAVTPVFNHIVNPVKFNFTTSKPSNFPIDRIPSAFNVDRMSSSVRWYRQFSIQQFFLSSLFWTIF